MEEIEIQGRKFISSKRAATITGYAKDYVGQLAREEKVPATRVGRAWYVDESAIRSHAGLTVTEQPKTAEQTEGGVAVKPEFEREARTEAELGESHFLTARQTAALYSLQHLRLNTNHSNPLKTWSSLKYSHEEEALLPAIKKTDNEHEVPVRVSSFSASTAKKTTNSDAEFSIMHDGLRIKIKSRGDEIDKDNTNRNQLKLSTTAITTVANLSVLFIVAGLIGFTGVYTPSEWDYSIKQLNQTASAGNMEFILNYFTFIFDQGVALLGDFLLVLLGSLSGFFQAGLEFLLTLLNQ